MAPQKVFPEIPKIVSLGVRAFQVSHLCFEVDGILKDLPAQLGGTATAFHFNDFFFNLRTRRTVAGDSSSLLYDPINIEEETQQARLASLRAEPSRAILLKALCARQNAFLAKYGKSGEIIEQMRELYGGSALFSKPNRLKTLANLSSIQRNKLTEAYTADGRGYDGITNLPPSAVVVKTTSSNLEARSTSSGTSDETGSTNEAGQDHAVLAHTQIPSLPEGGYPLYGATLPGDNPVSESIQYGTSASSSTSSSTGSESQTITNTDYGYRVPALEAEAQNQRAQISLMDEQFALFMATQNLSNLEQVFANELASIDSDVLRLQIAFLNTILMSPISGVVTGIYKQPGDMVRAGETVLRVEDTSTILIVGHIVYRGPIVLGGTLSVKTQLFGAKGLHTQISGPIVAVRGLAQENLWEVIAKCKNNDDPVIPPGYHFDYDDTTVTFF